MTSFAQRQAVKRYKKTEKGKAAQQEAQERYAQAINETSGQILSYQGGVVESLYAATQVIVDKAHKGSGMSQNGAYAYANLGYDYRQILGAYYPGVAIARLESK